MLAAPWRNLLASISIALLSGCFGQQFLTGEPTLYGLSGTTGEVVDRDLVHGTVIDSKTSLANDRLRNAEQSLALAEDVEKRSQADLKTDPEKAKTIAAAISQAKTELLQAQKEWAASNKVVIAKSSRDAANDNLEKLISDVKVAADAAKKAPEDAAKKKAAADAERLRADATAIAEKTKGDYDKAVADSKATVTPHDGEIIAIVMNSIFTRELQDVLNSPHVLVYAQVFDDGTDNDATATTKIILNQKDQPKKTMLGFSDRIIYGPTAYKGFPIRIKLFIVELDKEDKEELSSLINGAAGLASTAQPQYAAAIAVLMQVAQFMNKLNEDDFELRMDMTLFPKGAAFTASSGAGARRGGKEIGVVSPLRVGSYVVFKRELRNRFDPFKRDRAPADVKAASIDLDFTQQYVDDGYFDKAGKQYKVKTQLVYEGGYLYKVVKDCPKSIDGSIDCDCSGKKEYCQLKPGSGPNRSFYIPIKVDDRWRFEDRTYAVFSVVNGLPIGISPESQRVGSEREVAKLRELLDNSKELAVPDAAAKKIDEFADSLKMVAQQRSVADQLSRRVSRDHGFRTSVDYPVAWISQLDRDNGRHYQCKSPPPVDEPKATIKERDADVRNAGLMRTIKDLIVNLPIVDLKCNEHLACMEQLIESPSTTLISNADGTFRIVDEIATGFRNKTSCGRPIQKASDTLSPAAAPTATVPKVRG